MLAVDVGPDVGSPRADARVSPARAIGWRLFATCWLVYVLHFATNTVREIYPALALADHGTFDVTEYKGLHSDIFEMPGRGSFINNNPGASILGAAPYALARPVIERIAARTRASRAARPDTREYDSTYPLSREFYRQARTRGLDIKFGLAAAVMQAGLMAPLSALSVVLMFRVLLASIGSVRAAVWLALLYAFATPVFFRTAQLNQNLLLAHTGFAAFALIWRPWTANGPREAPRYFLIGLLCGWAVVLDYSGILVLAVIAPYALLRRRALRAAERSASDPWRLAAGAAMAVIVLLVYQWRSFGNPFLPAQSYMSPATYSHAGYYGVAWPRLDLLFDTAFSIRFGLFTSAPLLLAAFWFPAWIRHRDRILPPLERWIAVVFTIAFFVFCAANQYGRMQFNSGVRHIVPVVPFVFLLAASTLVCVPHRAAVLAGLLGVYWCWCLAMYRDVEQGLGIIDAVVRVTLEGLRLPWLTTLERMGYVDRGWATPVLMLCVGLVVAIWYDRGGRRMAGHLITE